MPKRRPLVQVSARDVPVFAFGERSTLRQMFADAWRLGASQATRPVRAVESRWDGEKAAVKRTFDPHRPMPAFIFKGKGWENAKRRTSMAGRAVAALPRAGAAVGALGDREQDANGWLPAEKLAMPLISSGEEIYAEVAYVIPGEWMLDTGRRHQSHHHTWQEALATARELPEKRQTDEVWIRFRQKEDAGICVFADDPRPVEERLAYFEAECREEVERNDSYRSHLGKRIDELDAAADGDVPTPSIWMRHRGPWQPPIPAHVTNSDAQVHISRYQHRAGVDARERLARRKKR